MIENPETGALEAFNFDQLQENVPELKRFNYRISSYQFTPPIDSSDMEPALWAKLVKIIHYNYDNFDGFVILHGTDTMAYTASALSFMLENLDKPVILTGSQLPIGVLRTDGKENLLNSQENIDTLTWLQDMVVNEGVSPEGLTGADADTLFQAGQLAMYMSGPWNINGLNQLGVNYGITAIPAGSAGAFSPEGGCAYMLTKGADDATRAAVYKFMAYWLSDATLKEWSNRNGFPVWSYSVLEDEDIKANEILSNVSKASEIGRDWHLNLTIGSQIDSDVMQPMMEKILAGADVAENVKAASDILDGIIAAQ